MADPLPVKSVRDLFSKEQLARSGDFTRAITLDRGGIDIEKRTAALSFSSEAAVMRYDMRGQPFYEVLDHGSVDMSRMQPGAPLLYGHDRRDHIGTVVEAGVGADKRGRAVVKFSRGKFAQEKFDDVQDGILHSSSVGYDLSNAEPVADGERDGIPVYRFRQWLPFEVTLCAIPADTSVGVGRSKPETAAKTPEQILRESELFDAAQQKKYSTSRTMSEESKTPEKPAASNVIDYSAERARIKDINAAAKALCERHGEKAEAIRSLASKCAETGDTIATFNETVLNDILGTKRSLAPVMQGDALIGMSRKDVKQYSVMRAIQDAMEGRPISGFERDCSQEVARKLGREPRGFFLPDEIVAEHRGQRGLSAGVPADGGFTVGQSILTSEFVTLLRNNTKIVQLGARYISGLQGDVSIPRQLTGATVYWVSETGSITSSSATFGQIVAKPRRVGTSIPYTKQFLAQTSLSAESFVVNDSDEATAVDLDRVAIRGGGGVEPLGILNLASGDRSTSVTFSGAATWAKYLEFFANVAANNALLGTPSYLTTPASAAKAMGIAKFTNGEQPIWTGDGKIGMFKAEWSTNFPSSGTLNQVIFGDFSQVIFLEWAGRDVVVDPYSGKKEGTVEITIQRLLDMVIRRGKSFAISSDTGAA
jgi:HK97 family phage major capsid protein